ncbi:hypothetical protein BDW02DRAFT_611421 [Decorospora gaudefroyi]|uniref:Uncharacterized protein n=1 Tax=Decorospora gaudefroyi TaxID=184978 RepID=A0A6A5KWP4_9PLEO|nr:hypothetical protein BDW02DRAFT_611421 [Decorospora gaudefroyi]
MTDPTALAQAAAGVAVIQPDPYRFNQDGRPTGLVFGQNPQSAYAWRHRSGKDPHTHPAQDGTISLVMARQEEYIAEMMQAMFSLEDARDHAKFNGRVLFHRAGAGSVSVPDVEAACRCLFQKILDQCHFGFSHGAKDHATRADIELTCEERFAEIINGLHDWKCICKDIFLSDDKMEDLANGPIAYYDTKKASLRNNDGKRKANAEGLKARAEMMKKKKGEVGDDKEHSKSALSTEGSVITAMAPSRQTMVPPFPAQYGIAPAPAMHAGQDILGNAELYGDPRENFMHAQFDQGLKHLDMGLSFSNLTTAQPTNRPVSNADGFSGRPTMPHAAPPPYNPPSHRPRTACLPRISTPSGQPQAPPAVPNVTDQGTQINTNNPRKQIHDDAFHYSICPPSDPALLSPMSGVVNPNIVSSNNGLTFHTGGETTINFYGDINIAGTMFNARAPLQSTNFPLVGRGVKHKRTDTMDAGLLAMAMESKRRRYGEQVGEDGEDVEEGLPRG